MKAKMAHKGVRHAMPAKKHRRTVKPVPTAAPPAKKEVTQPETGQFVAAVPQVFETTFVTFEEPLEIVVPTSESVFEFVEIFDAPPSEVVG